MTQGTIAGKPGGQGVEILYTEPQLGRHGRVTINCKPGGLVGNEKAISPVQITDPYQFTFDSSAACPGGGGLSGGSILLIIIFSLLLVYIAAGAAFNYLKLQARTPQELFPHLEFWKSVPGLVQDGVTFTIQKIRGLAGQ